MTKSAFEAKEQEYFSQYVNDLVASHPGVSHFELNLETWRQLWRVTEMADVLLLVVDCRYPKVRFCDLDRTRKISKSCSF